MSFSRLWRRNWLAPHFNVGMMSRNKFRIATGDAIRKPTLKRRVVNCVLPNAVAFGDLVPIDSAFTTSNIL